MGKSVDGEVVVDVTVDGEVVVDVTVDGEIVVGVTVDGEIVVGVTVDGEVVVGVTVDEEIVAWKGEVVSNGEVVICEGVFVDDTVEDDKEEDGEFVKLLQRVTLGLKFNSDFRLIPPQTDWLKFAIWLESSIQLRPEMLRFPDRITVREELVWLL